MSFTNARIEQMTRQRALSGIVLAYLCAALMVAGPWIFTMIGIAGLSAVNCAAPCGQLPLFRTIVIYNSMFSLVVTSPLGFFAGRHAADELHGGRTEGIFAVLVAELILLCLATLFVAVPLYGLGASLDGPTRLAAVQNALLIGVSWLLIPFLGALRAHGAILAAFGAGAGAMAALGWALADPGTTALLTGFNASFALIDAIMMACLVRRIGSTIHFDAGVLWRLREKWDLPACGLAYALGIWADKAVMWYGSPWQDAPAGGLTMAGVLRTMPSYDTAVFWAQLVSIPVVAIAFVHVETELRTLFGRFYGRIGARASLRELTTAIQKLRICVISSIAVLFVALAIIATMSVLFSFVFMSELGLRPSYMSILRISLAAMAFHSSAMFCFVFLLYFDLRRQALLIVATYAVLNILLTMAFLEAGQAFYGYGSMIAAATTFVVAFAVLLRELPWLHYHAFITNNSSL
jgi:uncharacterized membrane protein